MLYINRGRFPDILGRKYSQRASYIKLTGSITRPYNVRAITSKLQTNTNAPTQDQSSMDTTLNI